MGKRQGQNSHRRTQRHHVTFLFSLLFLSPSLHPSLPHIHDPVINLVEISRSLINACPPSLSSRRLFLFRLCWILGIFSPPRSFISSFPFCLFR